MNQLNVMRSVYVLLISVNRTTALDVGTLGKVDFKKGSYAYVGSAQNDLKHRVERHLRENKPKFWHIDYLLHDDNARICKVLYREMGKPEECKIAKQLSVDHVPVKSFGSSDCHCVSHLFKLQSKFPRRFMQELAM
ncbi:GIY-YIG nuclease family protein [Candidatus Bathyarchaeota archaeon]|nr:GIY-YIG nuclease family protein [Candidatus Bathyarchaeota archaeon]